MKIALGIITRNLDENNSIIEFVLNAKKYGYKFDEVIIGYADKLDKNALMKIKRFLDVKPINVINDIDFEKKLNLIGIQREWLDFVIHNPQNRDMKLLPYGMLRNNVILKAIIDQIDYLVFVDTDVSPEVMYSDKSIHEIDFIGTHLKSMKKEGVLITTSDYSGYYIIPKIDFDELEDFLIAVGKERAIDFVMKNEYQAQCFDNGDAREPFVTDKILGGNLMIDLSVFKKVVPFFSSVYKHDGKFYLTRGEDTVLGLGVYRKEGIYAVDIDLRIVHDTYGHFPKVPDIYSEKSVKDRLYYASVGWIGRNPFMYWINGVDPYQMYLLQKKTMKRIEKEFSYNICDERFERLSVKRI